MTQHGFSKIWEKDVPECKSTARLWKHDATGAELLSFSNDDENKVFGISFRTPPEDSTGLPHILEHSVLCGSEKYPVKEPFVELLKGSLQTFLNAFTYPDKTCYPVASTNERDFHNLTDVYLDAVFFPRIPEEVFQQEGWHLEPDGKGNYIFKGVVYNEMKGVFSSPESVLSRYSLHSIFPDTVYGLESGGDPEVIPELTYEQFVRFHRRCYHPSNARIFFWGDDNEDARLQQVGEYLARFARQDPAPAVVLQPCLNEPVSITIPFAAGKEEAKGMVASNWLLTKVTEVETNLALRMLEHILMGMPASPLRRALIESGLGEDITGSGLEDELRQSSFSVGLRGIDPQHATKVDALIMETLTRLVKEGIDLVYIEAAINSIEFALREKNTGRFPVGLAVMLQSLTTWLHDADPLVPLRYEEPLNAIKARVYNGEAYFESLIQRYFLDNPHKSVVTLVPDANLGAVKDAEEQARVNSALAAMPDSERMLLADRAAALQAMQEQPDNPEDLARIPRLEVADMPQSEKTIPTEAITTESAGQFHNLATGGIAYVSAIFDLSGVPQRLFPLLSLFGRALTEMGTQKRDFVALNMAIACKTGGMDADALIFTKREERVPAPRFVVTGKCAPDTIPDLFDLMGEIILEAVLDDQELFLRMVLEEKARYEYDLVPSGHTFVSLRLRAQQSVSGAMEESINGITCMLYLHDLAQRAQSNWPEVLAELEELRRAIFSRRNLAWNITSEEKNKTSLFKEAEALTKRLPATNCNSATAFMRPAVLFREALIVPAQVNYVGMGGNLYDAGYVYHGSVHAILKQLRTGWLWEKVRVQGGAYGAFCSFDRTTGACILASYRDPNIAKTLDVFSRTAKHLQTLSLSPRERDAAIIGAIGELDAYLLPDAKGATAFARQITGDTPELRQRLREEILGTTEAHFHAFGKHLEIALAKGTVCALGGTALENVASEQGWDVKKLL